MNLTVMKLITARQTTFPIVLAFPLLFFWCWGVWEIEQVTIVQSLWGRIVSTSMFASASSLPVINLLQENIELAHYSQCGGKSHSLFFFLLSFSYWIFYQTAEGPMVHCMFTVVLRPSRPKCRASFFFFYFFKIILKAYNNTKRIGLCVLNDDQAGIFSLPQQKQLTRDNYRGRGEDKKSLSSLLSVLTAYFQPVSKWPLQLQLDETKGANNSLFFSFLALIFFSLYNKL